MTEAIRSAAHQHIIDARIREGDLIAGVVHGYIVETRNIPFADRTSTERRKEFVTPYFAHLNGVEKALVVSQTMVKISNVLSRIERERLETEDA
ncbi:hypothetical protein [uncultured Agrobacterium sp.]|uniref:hypothetical protein n=1 Tax=uncultured Agrobacterium sp. TaxID=157277 RepID=UPI0025905B22|nr:hypothetical protein [uncultured Agrobacterium sp.]